MLVKNIQGTSQNSCNCSSWLSHWGIYSSGTHSLLTTCSVLGCAKMAEVGAHVALTAGLGALSGFGSKWYIVPMCKSHNAESGLLTIDNTTPLASANVSETCGKGVAGLFQSWT